jgi:hypothetical protein
MNLKALITAITLVPQILPLVDQTVHSIETSLQGVSGSDKFKAAEAKVNSILDAVEQDLAVLTDLKAIVTPLINAAVAAFNAAGLFTHSVAAPTAKA